jgi:isoleucyl-tRNA synthetase
VLDRWARSRLNGTVAAVTAALDGYDTLGAASALESFVDDLSNWYVRRSRPRFWKGGKETAAFVTLYDSLLTLSKLLAPFTPFVADEIHGILSGGPDTESVHLQDWPLADLSVIDERLEAEMALARRLAALGRAARGDAKIKVRQPLRRALVLVPGGQPVGPAAAAQVAEELNVKSLEVVASLDGLIRFSVVPNFRELGPRLGKKLPGLKSALATVDGGEVARALETAGAWTVTLDGEEITLGPGDLEVRAEEHEEFALAQEGPYAVALDLHIDEDLRLEGLAREVVRALNDHRKDIGLAIADRIRVTAWAVGSLRKALERHGEWIAEEVLAVGWTVGDGDAPDAAPVIEIDGEQLGLVAEKV